MKNTVPIIFFLLLSAMSGHAQPGWTVDAAVFQYSMTMVAQIRINGVPNHAPDNHLALFSGGKIRGHATPATFAGNAYYYITLYANAYKGDSLYARAYIGAGQKVYESTDTFVFKHHLALGTTGEPVYIDLFLGERPLINTSADLTHTGGLGCSEVADIQATDNVNSEGNGLTYSITGGADAGKFTIHPQTGLLSWLNFLPDPQNPADANGDNRYEVRIRVTDAASLNDELLFVVRVTDGDTPLLICPPDQTLSAGTGACSATANQTEVTLGSPCVANNLFYERSGATPGGGSGQIPLTQPFNVGVTTVLYYLGGGEECSFTLTVEDDEPPAVACPASLTVSPTNNNPCSAVLNGIDATYGDNCSAALTHVLSGATSNSGDGQASGRTFSLGTTTVAYTAADPAGHTAACSFSVTVSDCGLSFGGSVLWEHDGTSGVQNATVTLSGSGSGSDLTDAVGAYEITIPPASGTFTLTPSKNINKLNGVTSADVTAIQQHLTNAAPLPGPFKRIAADVNKSNSITSVDATLLNQALAGNQSALNQITSWRFVPASYSFPNPNVPWGFPENISVNAAQPSGLNFKGIKLGDVVATWANPANFGAGKTLTWHVQDQLLEAGAEAVVEFRAAETEDLTSFQFTLWADPDRLQLLDVEPLSALPLDLEHFGTYKASDGEIRVVWAQPEPFSLSEGAPVFRLRFRVWQDGGRLSEALHLDPEAPELPAYCYDGVLEEGRVDLRFTESTGAASAENGPRVDLETYPNPFVQRTTLRFTLPVAGEVELRVRDAAGRVLFFKKQEYTAGAHREVLDVGEGGGGVLFVELRSGGGRVVRRVSCGR